MRARSAQRIRRATTASLAGRDRSGPLRLEQHARPVHVGRRAARRPGIARGARSATIPASRPATASSCSATRATGRTPSCSRELRRRRPGRGSSTPSTRCGARRIRCSARRRRCSTSLRRAGSEDRRRRELVAGARARPARGRRGASGSRRCSTFRSGRRRSGRASPSRRSSCARSTSSASTPRCDVRRRPPRHRCARSGGTWA